MNILIFQVHLEINPNQYEDDEKKFEALKDSDPARLEILKDLLSNHLELDCTNSESLSYTPGYFLGRHEVISNKEFSTRLLFHYCIICYNLIKNSFQMKIKLLNECDSIKHNSVNDEKLTIKFYGKDECLEQPSASLLPVYIHSCPSNFSTVNYFEVSSRKCLSLISFFLSTYGSKQM